LKRTEQGLSIKKNINADNTFFIKMIEKI